jgi:hypothetical protein
MEMMSFTEPPLSLAKMEPFDLPLLQQTLNSALALLIASHKEKQKHELFQSLLKKLLILQKKGEVRDLSDDFDDDFYILLLTLLKEGKTKQLEFLNYKRGIPRSGLALCQCTNFSYPCFHGRRRESPCANNLPPNLPLY